MAGKPDFIYVCTVSHPSTNLAQRCLTSVIGRGRAIGENRFRRERGKKEKERSRNRSDYFLVARPTSFHCTTVNSYITGDFQVLQAKKKKERKIGLGRALTRPIAEKR